MPEIICGSFGQRPRSLSERFTVSASSSGYVPGNSWHTGVSSASALPAPGRIPAVPDGRRQAGGAARLHSVQCRECVSPGKGGDFWPKAVRIENGIQDGQDHPPTMFPTFRTPGNAPHSPRTGQSQQRADRFKPILRPLRHRKAVGHLPEKVPLPLYLYPVFFKAVANWLTGKASFLISSCCGTLLPQEHNSRCAVRIPR